MNLRHLEWLIGELVPDPEMVVYGVLPYTAVDADRVIEQLWVLAGLEVGQVDEDLAGAEAGTADVRVHRRGRPRARPCSICGRSSARSGGRHGAICSRSCVTTVAGSPLRSATRACAVV
jgi:hypothetical protein